MKKTLTLILLGFLPFFALSQIPQAFNSFNYQATVRNADGVIQYETPVDFKIEILQNDSTIYSENHNGKNTGKTGVVNFKVGMGTDTVGNFSQIDWSQGEFRIKVSLNNNNLLGIADLVAVPYALYAAKSGGSLLDNGGRFVGSYPIHGNADGASIIKDGYWQQVTRTTYNGIESMFSIIPVPEGMTREYYLAIQSADNVDGCAEATQWRFWFSWESMAGHQFEVGRNWGLLNEGNTKLIQIPASEAQASQLGITYQYWRLEALIPDTCPGKQMWVYSISVIAIDRFDGATPTVMFNNDPAAGNVSTAQIADRIFFEPNHSTTLNGALDVLEDGVNGYGIAVKSSNSPTTTSTTLINDFGIDVGPQVFGIVNDKVSIRNTSNLGLITTRGDNNSLNVYISPNPSTNGNEGSVAVFDESGNVQAALFVQNGAGWLTADVKFFTMQHPIEDDKEIWYACIEGPEVAAYDRGTGTLTNGEARIEFSDHFNYVIDPGSMTVQITPLSSNTFGLAVIAKEENGFTVKELMDGQGNFSFDWEVKCVRSGYEDYEVIREKEDGIYLREKK